MLLTRHYKWGVLEAVEDSQKIREGMGVQIGFVITGLTALPTESLLQQHNL